MYLLLLGFRGIIMTNALMSSYSQFKRRVEKSYDFKVYQKHQVLKDGETQCYIHSQREGLGKGHDFRSQPGPEAGTRCTQEALWLPLSSAHLVTWLAGGRRHRPCCVQAWPGHPAEAEGLGQAEVGRTHQLPREAWPGHPAEAEGLGQVEVCRTHQPPR